MKKFEILIVVIVLLVLAFFFGCREKVESDFIRPFDATWTLGEEKVEPNEPKVKFISFAIDRDFPVLGDPIPIPVYEYEDGSRLNLYREPNEPKEPMKYSLPIPTWPDFIKLDRDLILRYDYPEPNNPMLIHTPSETRTISKGTKIYFKE